MAEKTMENPTAAEVAQARTALVKLANDGFIKFPIMAAQVGSFMTDLAQEYVKLRKSNPDGDKFETLKTAITNAQQTTSNTMLNTEFATGPITVLSEITGVFGAKKSIDKYLVSLA